MVFNVMYYNLVRLKDFMCLTGSIQAMLNQNRLQKGAAVYSSRQSARFELKRELLMYRKATELNIGSRGSCRCTTFSAGTKTQLSIYLDVPLN